MTPPQKSGTIIVRSNTPNSYTVDLNVEDLVHIGRNADETGRSIVLDSPEVSSSHAQILCAELGWSIRDLGSTNGTKLNGVRLAPNKYEKLGEGDTVEIAFYELIIESCPTWPGCKET